MPALTIPAPLIISSRLIPALRLPGVGTVHVNPVDIDYTDDHRIVYAWIIDDADGTELGRGEDLRSPAYGVIDLISAMSGILAFLMDAGDAYRAEMEPNPESGFSGEAQEWAYMHADELAMAHLELTGDDEDD